LPLVFLKRVSDVFDDEARLAGEFGSEEAVAKLVEAGRGLVRFYIPEAARCPAIAIDHRKTLARPYELRPVTTLIR